MNTEGGGVSELRKWLQFKKPTQCLKGYYNEMQIRSEHLLSPDKAYGCIAWNNRAKLCNFDPINNSPTVIVSESARSKSYHVRNQAFTIIDIAATRVKPCNKTLCN
jgi:hypothetical protein